MRLRIVLVMVAGLAVGVAGLAPPLQGWESSSDAATSVWDGIYTLEQAKRGETLYADFCAECHGLELQGDDTNPPLSGSNFRWDWDGLTVGDLFERLRLSMPDEDPKSMTTQQKADVLAFMLLRNDFPAGERELASTTRELRPILFLAVEP